MAEVFKAFRAALKSGAGKSWEGIQSLAELNPRYLSVLNGLIGDSLYEAKSRLAIPMTLIGEVRGPKIAVFLHGLCDSEETWRFSENPARSYGSMLQSDHGYSPLYLRYNSGLHISTNGKWLAKLMDQVEQEDPEEFGEIVFIGHSMGGLVIRSACHYGQKAGSTWVRKVRRIFFLGTPHQGADLEKLGHLTTLILHTVPNPLTKGLAALSNKRSAGIKDLRFGYLLDEDWTQQHADRSWRNNRHYVPLLEGVEHCVIAGTMWKKSENPLLTYLGDGLVPTSSAAGRSRKKAKHIPFAAERFRLVKGVTHGGLTRNLEVYEQIRAWCESTPSGG